MLAALALTALASSTVVRYEPPSAEVRAPLVEQALTTLDPRIRDAISVLNISGWSYEERLPRDVEEGIAWLDTDECTRRDGKRVCLQYAKRLERTARQGAFMLEAGGTCLVYVSEPRLSVPTIRHEALHCWFDSLPEEVRAPWLARITIDARRAGYCDLFASCDAEQYFAEWYAEPEMRCPSCALALEKLLPSE